MTVHMPVQKLRLLIAAVTAFAAFACGSPRGPLDARPSGRATAPRTAPTHLYVVRAGDSLSAIAECSGTTVDELARLNRIEDPARIAVGARLHLPSGHPCIVPARRHPPAPERKADPARSARVEAERLLASATALNDSADFEAALAKAEACVARLAPFQREARANQLGARCHVVAGMAAAGLDQRERAIAEFRRAFALDPDLKLAPETTSPRILELVSAARSGTDEL